MNPTPTPPRATPAPSTSNATTRAIFYLFFALLVIGGLNWLLYGINKDYDLVALLGGFVDGEYGLFARIVYALVGVSALAASGLAAGNSSAIFTSTSSTNLTLFYLCFALLVVGGLNWGLYAIDKKLDLVALLGGYVDGEYGYVSRGVYEVVGVSALAATGLAIGSSSSIYATN
jgi:uncharacterized membrane protein YuzA (DUF378 family)